MTEGPADTTEQQKANASEKKKHGHFFHRVVHAIGHAGEAVLRTTEKEAGGVEHLAEEIVDTVWDLMAEGVGYAEMAGVRYPVKIYESEVSPELLRGSRVDPQQMAALKEQHGIKGIVNLCAEDNDDAAPAAALGLAALHLKIIDNTAPTMGEVQSFLAFVKANPPVYVHCEAGVGRTGTMCACYRIAVQGWTAEQAIAEAAKFGLHLPSQIEFLRKFAATLGSSSAPVTDDTAAASPSEGITA